MLQKQLRWTVIERLPQQILNELRFQPHRGTSYRAAAVSQHCSGCELPQFLPCREQVPPALAGSSRSSRCAWMLLVLLLSSRHDRSPLRLCSQKVKCNLYRTKAPQGEKNSTTKKPLNNNKPPNQQQQQKNNPWNKRFNVPTVLLSTGHSLCLLCYLTPSKEQFLGKKIVREFPISSASLLGFHFREGRNLEGLQIL